MRGPFNTVPIFKCIQFEKCHSVRCLQCVEMDTGYRCMVVVLVLLALVSAQVTFSRDWSGGKRAPAPFDCGQFTRLCRQFVHELKQAMSTDKLGKRRRPAHPQSPQAPPAPDAEDTNTYEDQ